MSKKLTITVGHREGDHQVNIGRGAKVVWLNTFATRDEALEFAAKVAATTGAAIKEPIK